MWLPRGGSHFPKANETHRSFYQLSDSSMEAFTCPCPPSGSQDLFFSWPSLGSHHPYSHVGPNAIARPPPTPARRSGSIPDP